MIDAYLEIIAQWISYVGVFIVILGAAVTLVRFIIFVGGGLSDHEARLLRHSLMTYLSIGLDFLIARDVIVTLSLEQGDYPGIIQLIVIIVIRLLLSFFIHIEEGNFHVPKKKK